MATRTKARRASRSPRSAGRGEDEVRLRAIIENVIDGIIAIDERAIVQSFNPAAEHMFGYAADKVIRENVKMLMPEPHHGKHDGYIASYLSTGEAKIIGIGRRGDRAARGRDGLPDRSRRHPEGAAAAKF